MTDKKKTLRASELQAKDRSQDQLCLEGRLNYSGKQSDAQALQGQDIIVASLETHIKNRKNQIKHAFHLNKKDTL